MGFESKAGLPERFRFFFVRAGLLLVLGIFLASCADTQWPEWLTREPDRAVTESYKGPIAMPQADVAGKPWPNLGDVPERPVFSMTPEQRLALTEEMKEKNKEGLAQVKAAGKEEAVTEPPPVFMPEADWEDKPHTKLKTKEKKNSW